MSQPLPDAAVREAAAPTHEEVDVWWGSYAGRAMTPSFVVCGLLTAACFVAAQHLAPERGWLQLTFTAFASVVWLVQMLRWCHRFFTCNYRLTTRYLYVDRGFMPLVAQRFALSTIRTVQVEHNPWAKFLDFGNVRVYFEDNSQPPVVLAALVQPQQAAEILRKTIKKHGPLTPDQRGEGRKKCPEEPS
jgi:hypothetical protein